VEKLHCDLLCLSEPFAFLDILVPSVDKIKHDCRYSLPPAAEDSTNRVNNAQSTVSGSDLCFPVDENFRTLCRRKGSTKCLNERAKIEVNTRNQSLQQELHVERLKWITGSKCRKIVHQKNRSVALLRQ